MKALSSVAALLFLIASAVSSAQQGTATKKRTGGPVKPAATAQKPTLLKPTTVSGYVFALTKGGDLKPARLAKVYMFYSRVIGESADQIVGKPADSASAADVFAREVVNGLEGIAEYVALLFELPKAVRVVALELYETETVGNIRIGAEFAGSK